MKRFSVFTLLTILYAGVCSPAKADTVSAVCEYRPDDERQEIVRMPCRVSQRQGFVDIDWEDGVLNEFTPTGLGNWTYTDRRGGRVQRREHPVVGLWFFDMEAGAILVYWD